MGDFALENQGSVTVKAAPKLVGRPWLHKHIVPAHANLDPV